MRETESEREMADRHVGEQKDRIARQRSVIERLRLAGASTDDAIELLDTMEDLLRQMQAHRDRLSE